MEVAARTRRAVLGTLLCEHRRYAGRNDEEEHRHEGPGGQWFDLICPFFDTEYTFARNGIVPERVKLTYYEAGHMMYTHEPDFLKLSADLRDFLTD